MTRTRSPETLPATPVTDGEDEPLRLGPCTISRRLIGLLASTVKKRLVLSVVVQLLLRRFRPVDPYKAPNRRIRIDDVRGNTRRSFSR